MHETGLKAVDSPRGLRTPLVIGHRGAPAYRPEHTSASFKLAMELGADLIEPDLVVSRDGALIVRHDRELSLTTDIARRPEFAHRRATKSVRGVRVTDWFVEDFDLSELLTLRAVERMPYLRPLSAAYDGHYGILTLADVVELAAHGSSAERPVGVLVDLIPALPGPGAELPALVATELRRLGAATAAGPVILQAFEPATLRALLEELGEDGPPMVQLIDDGPEFDTQLTPYGLREISTYAGAIGPSRHRLLLRNQEGSVRGTTDLVDRAQAVGLRVYPWKLLPENAFLPADLRRGDDPAAHGNALGEARLLLDMGADALISDAPELAVRARAEWAACRPRDAAVVATGTS